MLCKICQNIVFTKPNVLKHHGIAIDHDWMSGPHSMLAIHQPSLQALKQSCHQGCHLCVMLWGRLFVTGHRQPSHREEEGQEGWHDGRTAVVLRRDWPINWTARDDEGLLIAEPVKIRSGGLSSSIYTSEPLTDFVKGLYSRGCSVPSNASGDAGSHHQPADSYTGSTENLSLARLWLEKCLLSHKECAQTVTAPLTSPTRLIDLEDPENPGLCQTEGFNLEYVTLSYCWGQGEKLLTERATYKQFCQSIPVDERLPRTFRDAFQVTKALGYRYIWIDALCIIQDDQGDVQQEMNRMAQIYQNSILTIAANSGPDTSSGLYVERDPRLLKPCNAPCTMMEGDQILRGTISFWPSDEREESSPLHNRGWVFQEQIMSTRILTFGLYEMRWTCVQSYWSETRPEGIEKQLMKRGGLDDAKLLLKHPDRFSQLERANNRRHNQFDAWYQLATSYSNRQLTLLSDKLPAIAGLAATMGYHYGGTYSAGLWKEDLQTGLTWYVVGSENGHRHSSPIENEDYVAPSFSWASMTRRIIHFCSYEANGRDLPAEGLETLGWELSHVPGPLAPFGEVKSGILTVRGYLREALLIPCWKTWKFDTPHRRHYDTYWQCHAADPKSGRPFGDVAIDSFEDYDSMFQAYQNVSHRSRYSECESCEGKCQTLWYMSKARPVWCLLCLVREKYDHRQLVALLLIPCDSENHLYRRIGLLWVDSEEIFRPLGWRGTLCTVGSVQVVRIV